MAFVIIQHLDPTRIGIMPELLQRITPMKVVQVVDRIKVKPNCVYVIPPNKSMSMLNGALYLFEPVETHGLRLPIDVFFRSLADDRQEKSIGIILSGMGSDGSLGMKAIKEKNGAVLVQEPGSAKFDSMPRNAIQSVVVDIVAPATELPAKLIALLQFIPIIKADDDKEIINKSLGVEELNSRLRIFKRTVTSQPPELTDFPSSFYHKKIAVFENSSTPVVVENLQSLADQILLQRFAPASVMVNSKGDIVYITGRTGKYLEPVAGKANWNIHAMAREGLRQALPDAFRKALQNFKPVIERNIKMGSNGSTHFVDITVQCIESPDAVRGMVMIVFTDVPGMIELEVPGSKTGKRSSTGRQKELEIELSRSHEDLRSISEEMQTSQEELQSINEELTTSKEEMQSLNEELQTVNIELQSKVSDYARANDDMKNLLNSTEIATLFLDKELNIRRFTDQVTKIFKLRIADVGRPFTDLVTDLQYPEIDAHARQVIKTLTFVETSIATKDGRWFKVRIMPYRTLDDRIDGLVMTFSDITVAKKLEIELQEANEALQKSKEKK